MVNIREIAAAFFAGWVNASAMLRTTPLGARIEPDHAVLHVSFSDGLPFDAFAEAFCGIKIFAPAGAGRVRDPARS
jgi:hypothetical protein